MIKRLRFATRRDDLSREAFARRWPLVCAVAADAPGGLRPVRVAAGTVLPDLIEAPPELDASVAGLDGVVAEWFRDIRHLRRHDRWRSGVDGGTPIATYTEVIATEHILRGSDWLDHRWREGGDRVKHMAVAVRTPNLSAQEFASRWKAHAGTVARPGTGAVEIPDAARGCAYVQNHPVGTGGAAYDAVNEVYFDDVTGLRARIDWFRSNFRPGADDLFARSSFLATREIVVSG